jgi:mono/diheme cytochrome c family protein
MQKARMPVVVRILVGLYLLASLALAGCNKTNPDAPQAGGSDQFADTKVVFAANCAKCHSLGEGSGGAGNPGVAGWKPKGPNLGKVGAEPTHTRDWLVDHIRDPKKHKPDSRMPAFAGKLKDNDINALAEYLASLK